MLFNQALLFCFPELTDKVSFAFALQVGGYYCTYVIQDS